MNRWALNIRNCLWNFTLIILIYCNTASVFKVLNDFRIFLRNSIFVCQSLCIQRLMIFNWIILILWFQIKWWWFWIVLFFKSYLACIYIVEFINFCFTVIFFISVFHWWYSRFNGLRIIGHALIYRSLLGFVVITLWVLIGIIVSVFQLRLSNLASAVSKFLSSLLFKELLVFLFFL